ncbi:MAG: hypothetical protein AAFW47_02755 [Pseudomonadota bacterium]
MWGGYLKARKAKAAAIAAVAPFVERSRLAFDEAAINLDAPYAAGFVTVFITNAAVERVQTLNEDMMGDVQTGVWWRLFGVDPDLAGQKISLHSASAHPDFAMGCVNGETFSRFLFSVIHIRELQTLAKQHGFENGHNAVYFDHLCSGSGERERLLYEWSHKFEHFL